MPSVTVDRFRSARVSHPIPILMYHSISASASRRLRPFTVQPERFEEQARYIRDRGYSSFTVTDLVRMRDAGTLPAKAVVLTFDDGFADFYETALPILTQYRLTATLYVVSGYVGSTSRWLEHAGTQSLRFLSWSQLDEIEENGIEIGAHTISHPALDTLPIGRARDEIALSKRHLEDGLGVGINSFAYPYGYYSQAVRDLVVSAGYTSACAVRYSMSPPHDDRFALCRQFVRHDADMPYFEALLAGKEPRVWTIYDRLRSQTWRCMRQAL
jgi:peptidoglycan/xylan/chitin deacetylase (PgdA/CDA1 family)